MREPVRLIKTAATIGSLACLVIIIFLAWHQLRAAASLHRHWHVVWIFGAVLAQIFVYLCIAAMFRLSLERNVQKLPTGFLLYCAFAFLFANRSLPGPALAGIATLVYLMRGKSVPAVDAQAAAGSFYFADYAGFFTLIAAVSFPLLASQTNEAVRLGYQLTVAGIAAVAVAAVLIAVRPAKTIALVSNMVSNVQRLLGVRITTTSWSEQVTTSLTTLHQRLLTIANSPRDLAAFFLLSLLMHCAEVATVVLGAKAAGVTITAPVAAASYVAGNLASIISVFPGAVGFYEAGMVGTLHLLGKTSVGDAIVCTVIYRLLSFWAPLPVVVSLLIRVSKEGIFKYKIKESSLG